MKLRPFVMAALVAVALIGCGDPAKQISGRVTTMPKVCAGAQGDVYASGEPIAGAAVRLECPRGNSDVATSDAAGHFEYVRAGWMDMACTLVIEKEGYATASFTLKEICGLSPLSNSSCAAVNVQAELTPKP